MKKLTTNSNVPWPKLNAWRGDQTPCPVTALLMIFSRSPFSSPIAEPIEQVLEVRRQAVFEMRHIPGDVQFAALDVFVERRPFLDQQDTEDDHRQNRDHQADAQGEQRRQVALPAELQLQPTLQRRKDNAEDHRPEHRAVERQQDPDESDGHQPQQDHQ